MKKTYKKTELDCANCAAKREDKIKKLEGVNSVSVNFATAKITIDASDEGFDAVIEQAKAICRKIHRSTEIVTE